MHPSLVRQAEGPSTAIVAGLFLLVTGLLIVGLVVCALKLSRPDAVRKCYLGYILFTCGWLLSMAIVVLSDTAKRGFPGAKVGLAVFAVLGLAGVVLAALGLSEARREVGKTGQIPAVITLVLASAMLAGLGIMMVSRIMGPI